MLFDILVMFADGKELTYEALPDWGLAGGSLVLHHGDNSTTIIAEGEWREATVSPVKTNEN